MKRPLLTSGLCCNIILSLTCGPGRGARFLHQHLVLVNIETGVEMLKLRDKSHFTLQTKLGGLDNQSLWLSVFYKQLCHANLLPEFL